MIRVKNLHKSFGNNTVLKDLSFEIADGERVALVAPSGGGKTTLLRILCGLEKADGGSVEGIAPGAVAYQFQEPRLFPQLAALENVTCIFPDPKLSEAREAKELLVQLGLGDALHKLPEELSGGMKQRVALARALVSDRPILFLDEPFTALDPELRAEVREIVARRSAGKTLILVSHDPEDREILSDRTVSL